MSLMDYPGMISGFRVIENWAMTVPFEDWSGVRAPSRARRRMSRGFRQNIRHLQLPDPSFYKLPDGSIVGHPETVKHLRHAIDLANA